MKEDRIKAIQASAREIAMKVNGQDPILDLGYAPKGWDEITEAELKSAGREEEFPWLQQDLCARVYVYAYLRTIGQKRLENIPNVFRYPQASPYDPLTLNHNYELVPTSQTKAQITAQLDIFLRGLDNPPPPTPDQTLGLSEATGTLFSPSDSLLPDLNSPTGDILKALDHIPVPWVYKKELLEGLYNRYSACAISAKYRPETQELKPRRDLLSFSRLDVKNSEEIDWAANYFYKHLLSIYKSCQTSVRYCYAEAISNRNPIDIKYKSLEAMLLIWNGDTTHRMFFDSQFSRALSQRRHKAKYSNRVPLNTKISPESRSQLKKLAIRKGKTQYEVLEELIYSAFKNKNPAGGSE